ncbi:hypothetical protein QBC34DRAFT_459236 [Podospora aff. communis PSN243]|uniref:Uncharacterized protein n=1 Tax=Podospora aff. communis PSN243 TaxID=3040156 RepID=A0AAV9GQL2_9PEZI|nr:hypothetical protein QBC34DRAFT_459236 [Podospora aff. communis PSN243]
MSEQTEIKFTGDWRITVTSRDASWGQRVVARGTTAGTQTLAGFVGTTMDVYGNDEATWTLSIDHDDGTHGWQSSWIRGLTSVGGAPYMSWRVESEDKTNPDSDRDFNDLVIRLDKLGMVGQPVPPFAVLPGTLQAMPEGVFEATLGRYLMAVRVQNIWTVPWPATSRVGLSDRCRGWLAAGGVSIVDAWSQKDEEAVGQRVVGGKVMVGPLEPWATRRIFFKVDVSRASARKHNVEPQVSTDQGSETVALISKSARAPMSVSRTTFNQARKAFVSECDVGVMTASIKGMKLDLNTFRRAVAILRGVGNGGGQGGGGASGGGQLPGGSGGSGIGHGGQDCYRRTLDSVRADLQAFLDGKEIDLCALWRRLACCCAGGGSGGGSGPGGGAGGGGGGDDGGGDWTGTPDPGLTAFIFPTEVDYSVEYKQPFKGQYGPIPFDDPWWKVLLIIVAIILTIAAAASGGADLANAGSNDVIGEVSRAVLNPLKAEPTTMPAATATGSVDVAVVKLNGSRGLTPAIFTVLDAADDEASTVPIQTLGGQLDTPGTFLTNAQIIAIFQNLASNPNDPAAQNAVRAFKSGARSGTSSGLLVSAVAPIQPRGPEDDGSTVFFINQLRFQQDETNNAISCGGDSGSLWFQTSSLAVLGLNHAGPDSGDFATASRIEDVLEAVGVRFA